MDLGQPFILDSESSLEIYRPPSRLNQLIGSYHRNNISPRPGQWVVITAMRRVTLRQAHAPTTEKSTLRDTAF